jgi:PIN domain nuclease of toxin-antitoxin system
LSYLLDTKCVLLAAFAPAALPERVAAILADAQRRCVISAISPYELELKKAKGKIAFPDVADWAGAAAARGYEVLPVSIRHCVAAARLPFHHNDPWDRVLIAQAQLEDLTILSDDAAMAAYPVRMIW